MYSLWMLCLHFAQQYRHQLHHATILPEQEHMHNVSRHCGVYPCNALTFISSELHPGIGRVGVHLDVIVIPTHPTSL